MATHTQKKIQFINHYQYISSHKHYFIMNLYHSIVQFPTEFEIEEKMLQNITQFDSSLDGTENCDL